MRSLTAGLLLHVLVNGRLFAQAEVPTFTANDGNSYYSDATAEVGANDVNIDTSNGLSVTFGSEWSTRIHETLDANCGDTRSEDCQNKVKEVLGIGGTAAESGLQPRLVGALATLGGILLANTVGIIIALWKDDATKYDVIHVNIPKEQVDEVASFDTSENKFNFKPSDGDAIEVDTNFSPASKPTDDQTPKVTAQDNGDLEFYDGGLKTQIDDAFGQALCERDVARSIGRRGLAKRITVQCLVNKINAALRLVQPGGGLARLAFINPADFKTPIDIDAGLMDAISQSKEFAMDIQMPPDLNVEVREKVTEYLGIVAFAEDVGRLSWGDDGKMPISYSVMKKPADEEPEEEGTCPTDPDYIPICDQCGGNSETDDWEKGTGKCKGAEGSDGSQGVYKDCTCILLEARDENEPDPAVLQAAADSLQKLLNGEDSSTSPSTPDKPKNKAVSIKLQLIENDYRWSFYETEQGQGASCDNNKMVFNSPTFQDSALDIASPPLPSGDYNFDIWGRACKWRGNGENPGELICQDQHYSCTKAADDASTTDCPPDMQEHEAVYCEFDSDGPATTFVPGTCTARWWYDYPEPIVLGGKTKLRIEGVWDNALNPLGGAWGNENAGDEIKNDQKIDIQSDLGSAITLAVMGEYDYMKSYGLNYLGTLWLTKDTDESKLPHCRMDEKVGWASNNNRNKEYWSAFFSC